MSTRTPNDPLRVLLAGAGAMAQHHARAVLGSSVPARVVAVADPSEESRRRFVEAFPGVQAYALLEEALAAVRPDVVHVCTPPATHALLACAALAAGCHVYVEKPFASTSAEAAQILELAAQRERRVCAGHQLLYERPAREALALLPALGEIVHLESYFSFRTLRRKLGGTLISANEQLLDILPHPVYVLLHFLGLAQPQSEARLASLELGPAGTVHASVRAGGLSAALVVTLEGRPIESYLRVVGTHGTLCIDFVRGTVQSLIGPGTSGIEKLIAPFRLASQLALRTAVALGWRLRSRGGGYPGLGEIVSAFYASIAGTAPAPVSRENILDTVRICESIASSLAAAEAGAAQAARPRTEGPCVLITGGTGFLGKRTAEAFVQRGFAVRVLARRAPASWERLADVEYVQGDLAQILGEGVMKDVALVVHAAAETAGGWDEHRRNSIEATENVIRTAAHWGVGRVIHVSSLGVLSSASQVAIGDDGALEADPRSRGPYVWGKLSSEVRARELGQELGVAVKIVRPGALIDYEAFDPPGRLGKRVGNLFVAVGRRADRLGVVDVGLCAEVIAFLAARFTETPDVLNVLQPELPSKGELIQCLRGRNPGIRVVWFPWWALHVASWAARGVQRLRGAGDAALNLSQVFAVPPYDTGAMRKLVGAMRDPVRSV